MTTAYHGSIYHRSFVEPEQYHAAIRGGDSLFTLLGRGVFRAHLTTIQVGSVRLQSGLESLPRLAASAIPSSKIVILFWFGDGALPVVRGVQIQPGELLCLGPGMQSYHRISGPNKFAALTIDAVALARTADDVTGHDLGVAFGKIIRPPEHLLSRLRSVTRSVIRVNEMMPEILSFPQAVRRLEQALLRPAIACLQHDNAYQNRTSPIRQAALARKFAEVVEANLDQPLFSYDLCRMVGVPERTLRQLCQAQMGISPSRFLALRRLHLARQVLLRAETRSITVTEVAIRLGISELGRFSVAYKSLFGESPSVTLRRNIGE